MLEIFEKNPYISVPVPQNQMLMEQTLPLWKGFCSLPDETKKLYQMKRLDTDYSDPGYRDKKCAPGDKKELYHYLFANDVFTFIEGAYRSASFSAEILKFFGGANDVAKMVEAVVLSCHKTLGMDTVLLKEQLRFLTVRFLRYLSQKQGVEIADAHFDYSGLSLHLFPNNGELEYLWKGIWRPFEVPDGHAVLFPSYQAMNATGGRVDPLIHRAVQKQKGERVASVGFIPFLFCDRFHKGEDQRQWAREHQKGYLFEELLVEANCAVV